MSINIAVFASGFGSNLSAIIDSVTNKNPDVKILAVISNIETSNALILAKDNNIKPIFVNPKDFISKIEYDIHIVSILNSMKIDLVCLAGYMRILTPDFIREFKGKIMNIHPSLLPAFPGLNVQQKALDYGVKFSGCTVHFVDAGVDTGPIILQSAVPVQENDTVKSLSAKILKEEHKIYSEAIDLFSKGKLKIFGRKVVTELKIDLNNS